MIKRVPTYSYTCSRMQVEFCAYTQVRILENMLFLLYTEEQNYLYASLLTLYFMHTDA